EITLDPFLNPISTSIPYIFLTNNTYEYYLGSLDYNECVHFTITFEVDCSSALGQTHCTTAQVIPNNPCHQGAPFWDESSIAVDGVCDADSVRFDLSNQGLGDMSEQLYYFIRRDADLFESGSFLLDSEEQMAFSFPADGSTWRIEAHQANGHPGNSNPSLSIEGCVDGGGPFTTGYVTQFAPDDEDNVIDIHCAPNIGSYDPNDKQAEPIGYGPEHYIEKNTELEYWIRFQNTGTDTAFNIEIRDTLPDALAPWTLRMLQSSHEYRHNVLEGNILVVRYDNIMLPDSNVNLVGSNGFFKFKIRQRPNQPIGTLIENSAAIYFDFNEPIITNTVFHEIGEDFLVTSIEGPSTQSERPRVKVIPNPWHGETQFEIQGSATAAYELNIYDPLGRRVDQVRFSGTLLNYQQAHLVRGIYFFEVRTAGKRIDTGRMIIQ
ncbi:MAG: T9SS type A sorting domain-containing protein, partial [Bacteroidota bacterium]